MANITEKLETFFIIIAVALIYYIQYYNWGGAYADTDNYMHALRTLDFITSPTLFEHKFMMTNYPYCCYLFSAADKKILQTFTLFALGYVGLLIRLIRDGCTWIMGGFPRFMRL